MKKNLKSFIGYGSFGEIYVPCAMLATLGKKTDR
jgi:hypothetical protein